MKIAVYSSVFGEKDDLRAPLNYNDSDHIDYFLFSDTDVKTVEPYTFQKKPIVFNDIAKNARYFKIFGDDLLKDYDVLIWHDANIQIDHSKILTIIEHSKNTFLTTFTHPDRDDYYSEAMTCIRVGKDHSLRILKQSLVYFFKGMPAHNGMFSTGILIKNYKHEPNGLLRLWWKQTEKYSRRDQLSLAYSVFKTKSIVTVLEDNIFKNEYSIYHTHNYSQYKQQGRAKLKNYKFLRQISFSLVKGLRKLKKIAL
nr:glycosyltransferase domain-containing protein [uncultured Psychroserpens sp.]